MKRYSIPAKADYTYNYMRRINFGWWKDLLTQHFGEIISFVLIYSHSSQPGTVLPPGDVWTLLETFLVVSRRRVLVASSRLGPGMLLNILYHTGQPPRRWIIQPWMVIGVPRLRRQVYFCKIAPTCSLQKYWGRMLLVISQLLGYSVTAAEGLEGDFLGGSVVKNLPANAGNSDLILGSKRPLE